MDMNAHTMGCGIQFVRGNPPRAAATPARVLQETTPKQQADAIIALSAFVDGVHGNPSPTPRELRVAVMAAEVLIPIYEQLADFIRKNVREGETMAEFLARYEVTSPSP